MGIARQFLQKKYLLEKSPTVTQSELMSAYNHLVAAATLLKAGAGLYKQLEIVDVELKDNVRSIGKDLDGIATDLMVAITEYEDAQV